MPIFCFSFQNGFVECETESCPALDDCYILEKKTNADGCCDKCKGKSNFQLNFIQPSTKFYISQ